mgnify:CR=1 FL=1
MTPPLEGVKIKDASISKKNNMLGAMDELTVFIPNFPSTISFNTDVEVLLPEEYALLPFSMQCFRLSKLGDTRQFMELECNYYRDGSQSLRRVVFKNVC